MKITFFIGGLSGGGAERVVCNLANYLAERNHQCSILTMSEDDAAYELDNKVRTVSLIHKEERRNFLIDNGKRLIRLWKYLKYEKCDTYIVFLPITIILLLLFRRLTKANVIASERGDPGKQAWHIQKILKLLARRADKWVFQTEDAQSWYGDTVKDSVVIPNAINPAFIKPMYDGERRKVIVGAGRLNAQKNFALLINAFADIAAEFPDYSLTIYGEGSKRSELEQLVQERGIADRVSFPGYVKDLGDEIQDASVFVLSSDFEGMPNALMEAMALGLPCISTDCPVGGPKYLINNEENGLLIPVGDKKALINSLKIMLQDRELAEKMGISASEICVRLSPSTVYEKWEQLILL